jgi:pyrroloquinoline quinone (PQQ) biosynthesis protein C
MDELDQYIQDHRYSDHSFVHLLNSGEYTEAGLRDWAVQKYFQTREQNCVYAAVHFNARPHLDIRAYEVEQLVDEETNAGEGSEPHYALIKRLADAMGAPAAAYRDANIGYGVTRFVDYLLALASNEHPVIGMMGSYINENQTPKAAQMMYEALKRNHGLDDRTLEWFTVHAGADIEHADRARTLIIKYAADVPDFAARARWTVERGITEWRALQDYYYDVVTHAR